MSVGYFMILLDSSAVVVVIPTMLTEFHISIAQVGWVSSGYLVSYVVLILPGGQLGARFGQRNIYLAGLLILILASVGCGFSHTFTALIVARAVQGVGAALMAPQPMAVVTRIFPAQNRGPAIALWATVGGLAAFCGPIVGGAIVTHLGWQWVFLINLPIGVIAFALAAAYVPVLPNSSHNLDMLGTVFSGAAIALAVFGIQNGPRYHWARIAGSPITVSEVLALGLLFAAVFILHQWKYATEPLIATRIFKDRNFSAGLTANTIGTFVVTSLGMPLMLYAQNVRDMSPVGAALLFLPLAVAVVLTAPIVGRLTSKIQPRILAVSGFSVMLTVLTLLVTELEPTTPIWVICILTAVMGMGTSLASTSVVTVTLRNLSPDLAGTGSGLLTAAGLFSAVLASACMASILDAMLGSQSGLSSGDLVLAAERMRYAHGIARSAILPTVATFFATLICLKMHDFPELPSSFRWIRRRQGDEQHARPSAVSDMYSPDVVAVRRNHEC
ncbi:DHA2 family efflux MFS transporter permease subunit [Mycobacterium stomatepiae]|nr:DHA2 family efflux MFS transporter permease subunit [Mycobacterium stomatepiae]MCV7163538.1 DHA2 family efflux MFS transporter permease subunit [Mycobacterium stomatepiae]